MINQENSKLFCLTHQVKYYHSVQYNLKKFNSYTMNISLEYDFVKIIFLI